MSASDVYGRRLWTSDSDVPTLKGLNLDTEGEPPNVQITMFFEPWLCAGLMSHACQLANFVWYKYKYVSVDLMNNSSKGHLFDIEEA